METQQLIRKAVLGNADALQQIAEQHYDGIYAFCCRCTGSPQLGADLTQDTFLKMVQYLPAYKEKGVFKSWLFTIAANTCRDYFRKVKPQTPLEDYMPDTGPNSAFAAQTENGDALRQAINSLPDVQKEAIVLRYYHDFPLEEIAKITRVPLATVKTRLHRALKRMQAYIGEAYLLET
ncbi:MAG: RNA polymerase sigma factor [Oscillospiraceae bacterium]